MCDAPEGPLYYVYWDDTKEVLFYYDVDTGLRTYDKPSNASFFDPETQQPYVFSEDPDNPSELKSTTPVLHLTLG
jgi:hypothetical protein